MSGVAALVRSKYPALTATQVVRRITATAHNGARAPSNVVGAGNVDPVAALTWELPAGSQPGRNRRSTGKAGRRPAGAGTEGHHTADRRVRRDRRTGPACRGHRRDRRDHARRRKEPTA